MKILILYAINPTFSPNPDYFTIYYVRLDKELRKSRTISALGVCPHQCELPVELFDRLNRVGLPCEANVDINVFALDKKNSYTFSNIEFIY